MSAVVMAQWTAPCPRTHQCKETQRSLACPVSSSYPSKVTTSPRYPASSASTLEQEAIAALFVLRDTIAEEKLKPQEVKATVTNKLSNIRLGKRPRSQQSSSFPKPGLPPPVRRPQMPPRKRKKRTILLSPPPDSCVCLIPARPSSIPKPQKEEKRTRWPTVTGFITSHEATGRMRQLGYRNTVRVRLRATFPQYSKKVVLGSVRWSTIFGTRVQTALFAFGTCDQLEMLCPRDSIPKSVFKLEICFKKELRTLDRKISIKRLKLQINTDTCMARNMRN
mmetsp:Transcript_31853/g.77620  ORF Transcript_31853/g.77620 Transcript_31853/m.77620 type:complete len:279 (-) Transcript_31853:395-1231(-)